MRHKPDSTDVQPRLVFDPIYVERCDRCGDWTNLGPPDYSCRRAGCDWSEARFRAVVEAERSKLEQWAAWRLSR